MPYGGYIKENGITLCKECHIKAEYYYIYPIHTTKVTVLSQYTPNELFKIIESSEELARKACERLKNV